MKTTKYALAVVLGLIALMAPRTARADTVFSASGTFNDGAMLTGTVTINTITGTVTAVDLSTTGAINSGPYTVLAGQGPLIPPYPPVYAVQSLTGSNDLQLYIRTATLISFGGGGLCGSIFCAYEFDPGGIQFLTSFVSTGSVGGFSDLEFGSLSLPTAATPEPSTIILLGTGLLGLTALTWRLKRLAYLDPKERSVPKIAFPLAS